MDYVYSLFGYKKDENELATRIQKVFKGHLYRKKIKSATIIQKYYKRYNILRLSKIYKDLTTNEININHAGVEYSKGLENEPDLTFDKDDELEDIYREKRRQYTKLHRKLLLVKHELGLLEVK